MGSSQDYLCVYKKFFEDFAASVEPYDQLPVKVAGYYIRESEVTGEVIDWTLQYLSQKRCPSSLVTPLTKIVINEMKVACAKNPSDCGFVARENVYQPLRLMHKVMAKVNEVCLRYKDNGQLHTLPEPASKSYISACAIKNSRRRMEDRHIIIEDFHGIFGIENCGPASYFAVFDGHAGLDAACYSVSHLHQFLAENRHYPTDPERALKDAFLRTDSLFIEKSNLENLHSGTTAVCALLRPNSMLYVAWLGDSQALLVRRGRPVYIVNPHKPDREDERVRIEGMGGSVFFWGTWRVNGQLAVSRAIGDVEYKPYVTAEPDVTAVPLDGTEDFLILGCDGLWDFVSKEAIVLEVYQQLKKSPGDLEAVTERLVQLSKEQGSTDNISVIVVFLTEPTKLLDEPQLWEFLNTPKAMDTKSDTSNCQKSGFLLDLDSGGACKQNGTNLERIFLQRSTNGKEASEGVYDDYDDEDFGPETDVDTVDDVLLSPAIAAAKMLATANKNQLLIENQTAVDVSPELQKDQLGEFDASAPRGDTPTPPADEVAGVNREVEVENAGESGEDSEDEWNYFAVEPKKKPASETVSISQEKTTDCDTSEVELQDILDMESRLNPNAAEFVPSPTHVVPILEDCLLACSPRKDEKREIAAVPSEQEFDQEVRRCPSEEIVHLDNHVAVVNEAFVKPQFDILSSTSNEVQSTVLQALKNPFDDDFKSDIKEESYVQSEEVNKSFKFASDSGIKSNFLENSSEPMSFELKKETCPEMEPEPERVCLDTFSDEIAENGLSPTLSPDISDSSRSKEKIDFDHYIAICPPKPTDLAEDSEFLPEQTLESLVEQIHAEIKESADAVLSSCTTLPDTTTGLDETGGSLSPLDTDAIETKPHSTSDTHIFECGSEIIPESKHVDSTTTLSVGTTDSSPVNDLVEDDGHSNKCVDASPLSERFGAYNPFQEPTIANPLGEDVESLHFVPERTETVSPLHKYFGDDAPFHGFTESEPFQEHLDIDILQKNATNESFSVYDDSVGHLHQQQQIGKDILLHDRIEDVTSSSDLVEDVLASRDLVEDVLASRDLAEDVLASRDLAEDVLASRDLAEDVLASRDLAEDVLASRDLAEDVLASRDLAEDVLASRDLAEDVVASRDLVEDVVASRDLVEDVVASCNQVDTVSTHDIEGMISSPGKLNKLSDLDFDNFLHSVQGNDQSSFGIVSSTSPLDQELMHKTETVASASVETTSVDLPSEVLPSSTAFDLNLHVSENLSEPPVDSTVTNVLEPEILLKSAKVAESEVITAIPQVPNSLLLEENEGSKFEAEALEKELKVDDSVVVSRIECQSAPAQTPPPTPAVVELEPEVVPKFEPEILVETVEKLIVSPNKESDVLEHLQDAKVDDSVGKTSGLDVAPVIATAAAVTAGAVLTTGKTDAKSPTPKVPASSKTKKPLTDKTKSPATPKSPATQKTVAPSSRGPSSAVSKASPKPSVSPTKTLTSVKKTATPTTPTKPKSASTTPVTSSTTPSASCTPRSKPLSARPSSGAVKSPSPLKSSAPVQRVRPTSAVTKLATTEKKPAPLTNGTVAKPPVKEQVIIKRTTTSARTSKPLPSTVTAPKQPTCRSTTTKTTTATSAGIAARPKNLPSSIGVTKSQVRAPVSTVTQKQVKETANKQISSARPSSTVSISRTSTTTATSRRVTAGVTRTTTTTTSSKSNLGSKAITKKTTTITSHTTSPAKTKSPAIENNEQITTTMIATEMKVDPIETAQNVLLE